MEIVETARQAGYLAQLQTGAHPDGILCQTAGTGHHALARAAGLLAGAQSQPAQSQTGGRVDDAVLGPGLDGRGAGANRGGADSPDDADRLYHQFPTQEAQHLSTPG